jgi:putative ABC transport system permease protein
MNFRRRMENEIDRDIRDHIEIETRENIERGMPPSEARAAALRKFGNPLRIAEDTRAVWRSPRVEHLLQDTHYAIRGLCRNPVFAGIVILTLALGIGLNTAVFSVVNAVLIEPLDYPHPERLLWLADYNKAFKAELVGAADFLDWRAQAQSFDKMCAYEYGPETLAYGNTTERPMVAEVTSDFWPLTGIKPVAGRLFADADQDVIVLSHSLFERLFAADPGAIGKTVMLDHHPATVVGVLPQGFRFLFPTPSRANIDPTTIEAYVPAESLRPASQARGRNNHIIANVVARLKPGISLPQARSEMEAIHARIVKQYQNQINYSQVELRVVPLQEKLVGSARPALLLMLGAVTFVLLIACANIAGLLLARASTRRREVAIRAAVGAGRLRMIGQFLTEGLVLALAGGAAGLLNARWAIALLTGFGPQAVPRLEAVAIDGRVLAFTLLISLLSGLLFGLGPAISLARANFHGELKSGGKSTSALRLRLRGALVAGELALALVLIIGAGLMVKSLWRMNARPPGFHPESILVTKISLAGPAYRARPRQIAYFEEALSRLEHTPGVVAAGRVFSPIRGVIQLEDAPPSPADLAHRGTYYSTSPGYFRAMGMRLIRGRWMTDNEPSEVMMVNEAFVRNLLGDADPLGKRIHLEFPNRPPSWAIVGVVSDVKYSKLDAEPGPEVYFPYRQSFFNGASDVVVRTSGDPLALAPAVRKLISDIDPSQPPLVIQTLENTLARSIAPRRFNLFLLATFAGSALLLALIGIYGAMSYAVTQRTHEIGVRMALGARREEIVRMVIRQGMVVALAGIVTGIAAAFALTRLMATLLYDVKPTDPFTFAAVVIALTATALLASWIPSRKAARVDPLRALRYE